MWVKFLEQFPFCKIKHQRKNKLLINLSVHYIWVKHFFTKGSNVLAINHIKISFKPRMHTYSCRYKYLLIHRGINITFTRDVLRICVTAQWMLVLFQNNRWAYHIMVQFKVVTLAKALTGPVSASLVHV